MGDANTDLMLANAVVWLSAHDLLWCLSFFCLFISDFTQLSIMPYSEFGRNCRRFKACIHLTIYLAIMRRFTVGILGLSLMIQSFSCVLLVFFLVSRFLTDHFRALNVASCE
jgi:hypothetical protein